MPVWESLEGNLTSAPCAASWGDEKVQVFALQSDGNLWNRYWDGEQWHAWEPMGGPFVGHPAAAARDADRIDVLAIDATGVLLHRHWDGSSWVPWTEVINAPRLAKAVACSWSSEHLDVFVWSAQGDLWHARLA